MTFSAGSGLLQDDRLDGGEPDVEEHAPRGDPEGPVRVGQRRPPRLERARPLLRELADLPRSARPRRGHDLRGRGERVARLGDLAQPRPRRDVGALERRPWLPGRGRRAAPVQGLARDARARPVAGRGRVRRAVREHRRRQDLLAPDDVRRPGGPRGLERPRAAAARPPRPLGDHPAPGRERPLLGDRPGLQPVRDERRRPDVGAAQQGAAQGLARRLRGHRLLRPQGCAGLGLRAHVPAEPRRHAPQRRRRQVVDGDHGRACRPSSASRQRRTRTTATPST